jgi:tRNA1(Val) A37 N6-methylase TrmN6
MGKSSASQRAPSPQVLGRGVIHQGNALQVLDGFEAGQFQLIIADPPYFQVLLEQGWDNSWKSPAEYLDWTVAWVRACKRALRPDGRCGAQSQSRRRLWRQCARIRNATGRDAPPTAAVH